MKGLTLFFFSKSNLLVRQTNYYKDTIILLSYTDKNKNLCNNKSTTFNKKSELGVIIFFFQI